MSPNQTGLTQLAEEETHLIVSAPKSLEEVRVLIAEDDDDIRELMLGQLSREHYTLRSARNIAEIHAELARGRIDVMVLDLNFPDGDGLDLCRDLRAGGYRGAIIMVTARDASIDRVLGLELGANDYLAKPFEPRELLLRVRNLVRSLLIPEKPGQIDARTAEFGVWRLDLHQRRLLSRTNRLVILSNAEFQLLLHFVEAPDQVLSRESLQSQRRKGVLVDRSIDLQISRLRQKLALEPGGENAILTIRSEGYLMPGPITFQ